jgi:hypothetical protein
MEEEKLEQGFRTLNTLDCCKDKNCEVCGGKGYISPTKEALKRWKKKN